MNEFPHLHLHTTHSHLDAFGTPGQFYEAAANLGMGVVGHTEHGNISSWPSSQLEGKKTGITPAFGIEAYVVKDPSVRERGYNHVTLLAANQEGIGVLFKLVSKSFNEGFFYKPRMAWKDIIKYGKDCLFVFSGCWSGFAAQYLIGKEVKNPTHEVKRIPEWSEVDYWLKTMKKSFGDRFMIELMPIYSEMQKQVLGHEIDLASRYGIKTIATNDCHYIEDGHHDEQDDLVCIRSAKAKDDPDRPRYDVRDLYLKTEDQMRDGFRALGVRTSEADAAIARAFEVAEAIRKAAPTVPEAEPVRYRLSEGKALSFSLSGRAKARGVPISKLTGREIFREVIKLMWEERSEFIPRTKQYVDRVKTELAVFEEKDYIDYMLIIWDLIWAAKTRPDEEGGPMFIGPARGSSAGSLICYILAITEIDPFYDALIFERFVDPNRTDPPDIDIDFPDDERGWVMEYLKSRWGGEDHVGTLISHAIFKGKIALTDIAKVYRVPKWAVDRIKGMLIERSSGDARASFTIEDTMAEFAEAKEIVDRFPKIKLAGRLEGQIRHNGKHAAAMIVSTEKPLNEVGAFYREGRFWMDKRDAEKFGHLKIDALGLNTLTVLREAARNIGLTGKEMIEFYYRMDMRDAETIKGFTECDVEGVFQFDGRAQMVITKKLAPETYEEVRDLTAMSRPGPLHCGGTENYIARARGDEYEITPKQLEPVTKNSYGVILYQEQVMEIMRDIGRMSWPEIVDVRRHISKSVGKEHFEVFHDSFNKGALGYHKIPEAEAEELWDAMCTFGSWAFNRAHAASYTRLSMWTMWMKRKHPHAYLAAMAGWSSSEDRKARAIRLFQRRCGPILPVRLNLSGRRFRLEATKKGAQGLRIGYQDIKGVGEKAAINISESGPYATMKEFIEKVTLRVVNKRVRKVLHVLGAFKDMPDQDVVLVDRNVCEVDEYLASLKSKRDLAASHCFWVFPLDMESLRNETGAIKIDSIKEVDYHRDNIKVCGIIRQINQRDFRELGSEEQLKRLKPGEETKFINITIEDEEGFMMVTVPRRHYRRMKGLVFKDLAEGKALVAQGTVLKNGRRMFLERLWSVKEV